jgi:hypothetical protein
MNRLCGNMGTRALVGSLALAIGGLLIGDPFAVDAVL